MNRYHLTRVIKTSAGFLLLLCGAQSSPWAQVQTPAAPTREVFNLAVVGPLTPSSKAFGIAHLQAITLAVNEYNRSDAQQKRQIQLGIFDDEANPAKSVSAFKFAEGSGALAVLGPANSSASKAIIETLHKLDIRMPVISSLSSATKLTENLQTEYFIRANVSDGKRLAALLNEMFSQERLKPRRLIAFYERADAFGEGMLEDTKKWLRTNNHHFLDNDFLEMDYPRDVSQADAAQIIAQAYEKGFGAKTDAILLLGIAQDAVMFIDVLRKKNIQSRIFFNEPDNLVFKAAADRGVSIKGVHVLSIYWPENATVDGFKSNFKRAFNEEPSFSAALSYDAARMVFRAIDVASLEAQSANDVQRFRERIQVNLRSHAGPPLDYVLAGDHQFDNHEFRKLSFQGLHYTARGELVPWDKSPDEPERLATAGAEKPIVMPPLHTLIFVVFFGFIGSTIREFHRRPPENFWSLLARLPSPISLIVDPAISLIVFGCIFLLTILTRRSLLEIGGDALLLYNVASIALGAVSGFLGLRALFVVIKHLGIEISDKELVARRAK